MKNIYFTTLLFLLSNYILAQNNPELQKMYDDDQSARMVKNIDWTILTKKDKEREKRVFEMIDAGEIKTGKDYYNSAMIFQHGNDTIASKMAVEHMKKAINLDSTINKWLLAAAIDRDLMRRDKPQIYGTQYIKNDKTEGKWKLYTLDPSKITDEERKYYNVETLEEQIENERKMNLLSLDELIKDKPFKQIIPIIKSEHTKGINSLYNVGEDEINNFGYQLISENKNNEALEIFKLNTQLYPQAWNTYDSYGELLLKLNHKKEAYKNYKKSLQLNPKNDNAIRVLKDIE